MCLDKGEKKDRSSEISVHSLFYSSGLIIVYVNKGETDILEETIAFEMTGFEPHEEIQEIRLEPGEQKVIHLKKMPEGPWLSKYG